MNIVTMDKIQETRNTLWVQVELGIVSTQPKLYVGKVQTQTDLDENQKARSEPDLSQNQVVFPTQSAILG